MTATQIVPTQHAKLSPSGAHRWMPCPGSLVMEAGIPDTSSEFADEGTAAHELAGWCLTQGTQARGYIGRVIEVPSRNGEKISKWEVTEEMADYVQTYVDDIRAKGGALLVEERVNFSRFVGVPDSFGTSDAIIFIEEAKELNVDDLKYGRGVRVYASEVVGINAETGAPILKGNKQLMTYALGAYDELSLVHDIETIRITIHQPRLDHVSEHVVTVEELMEFADELKAAAERVQHAQQYDKTSPGYDELFGGMFLNPGEKQCQWCKAKATCPALRAFIAKTVLDDFDGTDFVAIEAPKVKAVPEDNEELAKMFGLLDMVSGYIKAVAGEMHARMMAGKKMPGYKLVEGKKGSRAWIDESEAEKMLKAMRLKQEAMYSMKVISPTQAEKLLKANNPKRWNKILRMVTQSDGQPHIALESDRRPALVVQSVADDFADDAEDLV